MKRNNQGEVILTINQGFSDQISDITTSADYDDLYIRGARAPWSDILTVYAVAVTTDITNPQASITVNDNTDEPELKYRQRGAAQALIIM